MISVSVIIPTYNRADFIQQTINSLLNQTHPLEQIIVVDDGSQDDTQQVLANYGSRITLLTQPNAGPAAARNNGLRHAQTDYIAFLDSDDTLPIDSISTRVQAFKQIPKPDIVYGNVMKVNADGQPLGLFRNQPAPSGNLFAHLARHNVMPITSFMFQRTAIADIWFDEREAVRSLEDYDFLIRVAPSANFAYIDKVVANYTIHPQMTTLSERDIMKRKEITVQRQVFEMEAFNYLTNQEKAAAYNSFGSRHATFGMMDEARHWYWKSLQTKPTYWRTYILMLISMLNPRLFNFISKTYRNYFVRDRF